MATSRRREIVTYLVNLLKTEVQGYFEGAIIEEDGDDQLLTETEEGIAQEDIVTRYDYKRNVFKNVFNGLKFIDQINDFPSMYLQAGTETYNYDSKTATTADLMIMIRVYTYEENSISNLEDIVDDVVHVIERIQYTQNNRLINCSVVSVDTDSGLLEPYGLGEIRVSVLYDVED